MWYDQIADVAKVIGPWPAVGLFLALPGMHYAYRYAVLKRMLDHVGPADADRDVSFKFGRAQYTASKPPAVPELSQTGNPEDADEADDEANEADDV